MIISLNQSSSSTLYHPFESMSFNYEKCFLCGTALSGKNSVEHVFPKWILNRYNLWNQKLMLPNRTPITYRQLIIPCCTTCNNVYLSQVEKTIQESLESGFQWFINLDELIIFQWIAKIYYGLLFKDLSLLVHRKGKEKGTILSSEQLKRYQMLHELLQSVRVKFEFDLGIPWSIFIFRTHQYGDERDFDYYDMPSLNFSIRIGEVGIVACLGDNGALKEDYAVYLEQFKDIKLHPIQFNEIAAFLTYKTTLINRTPNYLVINSPSSEVINVATMPIQGMSSESIYNQFNDRHYAQYLAHFWHKFGLQFTNIYDISTDFLVTYLKNEDDNVHVMNADGSIDMEYYQLKFGKVPNTLNKTPNI